MAKNGSDHDHGVMIVSFIVFGQGMEVDNIESDSKDPSFSLLIGVSKGPMRASQEIHLGSFAQWQCCKSTKRTSGGSIVSDGIYGRIWLVS